MTRHDTPIHNFGSDFWGSKRWDRGQRDKATDWSPCGGRAKEERLLQWLQGIRRTDHWKTRKRQKPFTRGHARRPLYGQPQDIDFRTLRAPRRAPSRSHGKLLDDNAQG